MSDEAAPDPFISGTTLIAQTHYYRTQLPKQGYNNTIYAKNICYYRRSQHQPCANDDFIVAKPPLISCQRPISADFRCLFIDQEILSLHEMKCLYRSEKKARPRKRQDVGGWDQVPHSCQVYRQVAREVFQNSGSTIIGGFRVGVFEAC